MTSRKGEKMAGQRGARESSIYERKYFEQSHSYRRAEINKRTGKKPLPAPTHVGHFILMVIMKMCRLIVLMDTSVKIGIYLAGVMVGSVLCDLFAFPRSYFSNKANPFNVFFVKMGWGWTSTLLLTYIFLTSFVYCCGRWADVRKHMGRLLVATAWWYTCTKSFEFVDNSFGSCSKTAITEKLDCIQANKKWTGLDISGHVFLLIHCLLTISEEAKVFKEWKKLGEFLYDDELKDKRRVTDSDISQAQISYKSLTPLIKVNIIFLSIIMVLWEFMLVISVIYRFHTLPQKISAAFVAVFCWFISYRVLYRSRVPWLPCQPGDSVLSYMKLT